MFLEKLWKVRENIEILNSSQQKEEDAIWRKNQIITLQIFFTENLLAIEMTKTEINMNKPFFLGLSILESGIILMYKFWYDCVKPKYC